jgi:hypothetical protein
MKTHYATVEYGNESNPSDEWSETVCGIDSENTENNWKYVDCKKCLKRKAQYEEEMKIAMEHNINDMKGFVEIMEQKN